MTPTNAATSDRPRRELSPRVVFLIHVVAFALGLKGAFVLNRTWMPNHAWSTWLAIAWGVVFGVHVLYAGVLELVAMRGHDPT